MAFSAAFSFWITAAGFPPRLTRFRPRVLEVFLITTFLGRFRFCTVLGLLTRMGLDDRLFRLMGVDVRLFRLMEFDDENTVG